MKLLSQKKAKMDFEKFTHYKALFEFGIFNDTWLRSSADFENAWEEGLPKKKKSRLQDQKFPDKGFLRDSQRLTLDDLLYVLQKSPEISRRLKSNCRKKYPSSVSRPKKDERKYSGYKDSSTKKKTLESFHDKRRKGFKTQIKSYQDKKYGNKSKSLKKSDKERSKKVISLIPNRLSKNKDE